MIAWLSGTIQYKNHDSIILNVNGLGYEVFVTSKTLSDLNLGDAIEVFIYEHIREDAQTLFGFVNHDDLEFFKNILTVKGVGPKIALAILSAYAVVDLLAAINNEDVSILTNISGIGLKSAQRIILELKGKVSRIELGVNSKTGEVKVDDLIPALQNLGYSMPEIRLVLAKIPQDGDLSARLKAALATIN